MAAGHEARTLAGKSLLALMGYRSADVADADDALWPLMDAIAADHRLQPHLHGRLQRGAIACTVPEAIQGRWRDAYRSSAITALGLRRDLLAAAAVLGAREIASVALKGSVLAWTVWPAPAERAMRDIDLLVPQDRAVEAYAALREAGWSGPDTSAAALAELVEHGPHLPPLLSPAGSWCELHSRPWRTVTGKALQDFRARSRQGDDGIAAPDPQDLLVHAIVHATDAHLFDVGPLVLADIDYILRRETIDWTDFWQRAERDGFMRQAALVLALAQRWRCPGLVVHSLCPFVPDKATLAQAEELLVQEMGARQDVVALASFDAGSLATKSAQHPLDRAAGATSGLERLGQLAGRAISIGKTASRRRHRRTVAASRAVRDWMAG